MADRIPANIDQATAQLDALVHRSINPDVKRRDFRLFRRKAAVYFVDGLVSGEFLQHYILAPIVAHSDDTLPGPLLPTLQNLLPVNDIAHKDTLQDTVAELMGGIAILLVDGMACAVCFDIRGYVRRGISPPLTESVINGPHQGFNESLRDNITMIRRSLPTPQLVGEMMTVGDSVPATLCVMYLADAVDPDTLECMKRRLKGIRVDHVLSIGALAQLVEDRPSALLPQVCLTERPDRAASFLREGQIVVVMDGSPQILAAPVSLAHLLHTPDDSSMRWQYGSMARVIRLIGALCTLLLPGLFVAMTLYHPEALPVAMLTAIMESKAAVPLSIPAEMLLMLLMLNLINEASIRIPGMVGASLGTVSGLILGQAAVNANLVHPLMIIVVAVASLGNYALPDQSLTMAFRIGQLVFLFAAWLGGVYGMMLALCVAVLRVCGMRSFGSPFAAPVSPVRPHNPDVVLRLPLWRQRLRTWLGNAKYPLRAHGRVRRWDKP